MKNHCLPKAFSKSKDPTVRLETLQRTRFVWSLTPWSQEVFLGMA